MTTKQEAKENCKEKLKNELEEINLEGRITTEILEWEDDDWEVTAFTGLEPNNPILGKYLDSEFKIEMIENLPWNRTIRYEVSYREGIGYKFSVKYNYKPNVYDFIENKKIDT